MSTCYVYQSFKPQVSDENSSNDDKDSYRNALDSSAQQNGIANGGKLTAPADEDLGKYSPNSRKKMLKHR